MPSAASPVLEAPSLALLITEPLRAIADYLAFRVSHYRPRKGDGHPVIVFPGLGGGAFSTVYLRRFLDDNGYKSYDWGHGVNTGPRGDFDQWLDVHVQMVRKLHEQHGRKVSLIGWSLGGVYARELAKRAPEAVRQVITLGTPFAALGEANHAASVYRLLNGDMSQLTPELAARLRTCPPVPTTAIYSRSDGVVCWQGCVEQVTCASESIEINASHLGMGTHPHAMRIIANRLAQREGQWKRMSRSALRRAGVKRHAFQTTAPLQAVKRTTAPKAMRYQANGTKLCVEM